MPIPDVTATAVGTMYTTGPTTNPYRCSVGFAGASAVAALLLGFAARKDSSARVLLAAAPVFAAIALPIWDSLRAANSGATSPAPAPATPKPASWVEV